MTVLADSGHMISIYHRCRCAMRHRTSPLPDPLRSYASMWHSAMISYQVRFSCAGVHTFRGNELTLAPFLLESAATGTFWRKLHYLFYSAMQVIIAIFSLAAVLHKLVLNVEITRHLEVGQKQCNHEKVKAGLPVPHSGSLELSPNRHASEHTHPTQWRVLLACCYSLITKENAT